MTDRATDHWRGWHHGAVHTAGPIGFLNPTTRFLSVPRSKRRDGDDDDDVVVDDDDDAHHPEHDGGTADSKSNDSPGPTAVPSGGDPSRPPPHPAAGAYALWRSRDNRKGRHALALTPSAAARRAPDGPDGPWAAALAGVGRMFLRFPVWDVSYDVALVFTLGSAVWVANGFFVLLPLVAAAGPSFPGESAWGGGVTAVVGATVFEVGSVLLMLEAVNESRAACFGWALREELRRGGEDVRVLLLARDEGSCRHHHAERRAWLSRKRAEEDSGPVDGRQCGGDAGDGDDAAAAAAAAEEHDVGATGQKRRRWTWWPSWYELRTHYFCDIGFLACLSQMIGATVFWISGFTGLPQILDVLSLPATNGIYWLPQVVGGTGFIVSSCLFMLETQQRWYIPAPNVLGWHVGFFNLLGSVGFTLCGAFGFASSSEACEIALTWSTFIGSWAFLIGSVLQWYESLDKYPIVINKKIAAARTVPELGERTDGQS